MKKFLIMVMVLTIGCATTGTMNTAALDEGIPKTFTASFDRVLKAARESVTQSGLQVEEVSQLDDQTWIIVAKKDVSAWSWGELVRVTVQKKSESETLVTVLTKRKLVTNISAKGDYSQSILSNIDLNLRVYPTTDNTKAGQLKELNSLKEQGLINEEEYNKARAKILNSL